MTKTVLYWDGIIANKDLAERYASLFQKILEGSYKEVNLDLKKLPNYRIYSVRVNDSDRLLFTTVKGPDNRWYLLLLGEVPNHDYHKSPFLKPEVLASFLENKALSITAQAFIGESDFQVYTDPLFAEVTEENTVEIDDGGNKIEPWSFYNGTFIQFNNNQQSVLQATLPLVISGAAGSGKSCVALSLLANGQAEHTPNRLYLSQSPDLVAQMRQLWEKHPSSKLPRGKVFFQTYADLLYEFLPELKNRKMVGESKFFKWLDEYIKADQRRNKHTSSKNQHNSKQIMWNQGAFFKQKHLFYQECRIIAACEKDDYLSLGDNQSLIHNREEREWLFKAFMAYKDYMDLQRPKKPNKNNKSNKSDQSNVPKKQFDPAFYDIKKYSQFDLVVIDEAQDLSHCQLQQLFRLAENGRIAYCMDSHQSLWDSQSKRPYLLNQLLQKTKQTMQLIDLPGSYRCPGVVTAFANNALNIKFLLTGGLADKHELSVIQPMSASKKGQVEWYTPSKMPKHVGGRKKFAVITLEHFKAEAKELFDTSLVFTVEEIKGLEYKTVIAYNLLVGAEFHEANRLIVESQKLTTSAGSKPVNRPKNNQREERFAPLFNQLFTAFTRTTRRLVVIQKDIHEIQALIDALKQGLPIKNVNHSIIHSPKIEKNSKIDWEEEGLKLLHLGKLEQAEGVFIKNLGKTSAEFAVIRKQWHDSQNIQLNAIENKPNRIESHSKQTIIPSKSKSKSKSSKTPLTKLELKPESKIKGQFVTSKTTDYLNGLLNSLTNENLKTFFELPNWERLMFSTLVNSVDTFLSAIINSKTKIDHFYLFLKSNKQCLDKITFDVLCKPLALKGAYYEGTCPLYWFSQAQGLAILLFLVMRPTGSVTVEALCEFAPIGPSVLNVLSSDTKGRAILSFIFKNTPQLLQNIPLKSWIKNGGNGSALSMLRQCEHFGKPIIDNLPEFIRNIRIQDYILLDNLLNDFSEIHLITLFQSKRFVSLLFQTGITQQAILFNSLIGDENKSTLFFDSLEKNESYLRKMSPLLCHYFKISDHYCEGVPPLYWLVNSPRGRDLLIKHDFLLGEITAFGLLHVIYSAKINDARSDTTGREEKSLLINKILTLNPSLVSSLSDKFTWTNEEIASLFLLASYDDGHEVLERIINKYPEVLVANFTVENLFSYAQSGQFVEQSIFSNLITTQTGLRILRALFSINLSVLEGITVDAMVPPLSHSPFYVLVSTVDGRSLLNAIFKKVPGLAQDISLFHWVSSSSNSVPSALYTVAQCNQYGSRIFKHVSIDTKGIPFDQYRLLFDVWYTIDERSLSELFESEHFETLLFDTNITRSTNLFYGILLNDNSMRVLTQFLQKNEYVMHKITEQILCKPLKNKYLSTLYSSVFHMLVASVSGDQFLRTFPSLFKKVTVDALCRPDSSRSAFLSSPLFDLSMNYGVDKENNVLLKHLVDENPSLLLSIPTDALYSIHAKLSEKNGQTLMKLCAHKGGRLFLTELFTANPGLIKAIPVQAWCYAVMVLSSSFEDGHIMIENIITTHPDWFEGNNVDFLRHFYLKDCSVLANLAQTHSGVKSLKLLFVNNPQWMKQITALDISCLFLDELGQGVANTVLLLLTSTEDGRELLNLLFKAQPELVRNISFNSWIFASQEQLSPVISVKNCGKYGTELVASLPKVVREISVEDTFLLNKVLNHCDATYLTLLFKHTNCASLLFDIDVYPKTSLFVTILSKLNYLPTFLESLVLEQPAALKRITVDILNQTVSMLQGNCIVKVPVLILLCLKKSSQSFLNQLVTLNPELLGTIPAKTWCHPISKVEKQDTNLTALFLLTQSFEGMNFVKSLLDVNADLLRESITLDILCFLQPDMAAVDDFNQSILSNLLQSGEGMSILYMLLRTTPGLLYEMSVDILCRQFSDFFYTSNQFSLLYLLSLTLEGRYILFNILKNNPLLAESIPQTSWELIPVSNAESPITHIKKCGCYNIILNLLPENLQQIPQSNTSSVGFFAGQSVKLIEQTDGVVIEDSHIGFVGLEKK